MSFLPLRRRPARAPLALPVALALAACGDTSGPWSSPATLEAATPIAVTGVVGEPVDPAPAVRVVDATGQPMPGVRVVFSTSGGGEIMSEEALSDANGVAAVGTWTLGTLAGEQSLVATLERSAPIEFVADAVPGAAASLEARAGLDQIGVAGAPLPISPSVRLHDEHGNTIAGAVVTFAVTEGDGSVAGGSVATNGQGVATVASWTLGPAEGLHVLTARIDEVALPILARAVPPSTFDVDVVFLSTPSLAQRNAVERAVARWRKVVIGDVPSVAGQLPPDFCGLGEPSFDGVIDDLRILVDFRETDGPGGTLAYAGPCAIRTADGLTALGAVIVDRDDAASLLGGGQLESVVVHEIGHVLGIGTLWFDHVVGAGGTDPHYTGPSGLSAFARVGGGSYVGSPVPVENIGGSGTRDGHWRESAFRTELMTGFAEDEGTRMPLSLVTIGALEDLGYVVTPWGDDSYVFGSLAARAEPGKDGTILRDHPLPRPTVVLDATGRLADPRLLRPRAAVQRRVADVGSRPVQLLVSPR
jgi:hypothetical protein